MADGFKAKLDMTGAVAMLDRLGGPAKESLGRRMGVSGGVLLRDAAKAKALVAQNKQGKARRGVLAGSVYLAYDKILSKPDFVSYKIAWNAKVAPHGYLIEFGHWRYNKFIGGKPQHSLLAGVKKGSGPQSHGGPGALDVPEWVPAKPFLRPTIDAYGQAAVNAMMARAKIEFPILMAEGGSK